MKADWSERCRRILTIVVVLFSLLLLCGCDGLGSKIELNTRVNILGGGQHETIIAIPGAAYDKAIFDRLPDFSLITGVRVRDYRSAEWQGIQVTQPFYRLGQLSGAPSKAHFLNKAYPGDPLAFQAQWKQGFFTRDLQVKVFVNTGRSDALVQALGLSSLVAINATFTLQMPGPVIQHNGTVVSNQTIVWTLDPKMPQTLEATARVLDLPLMLSTAFTAGSFVFAILAGRWPSSPVASRDLAPTKPATVAGRGRPALPPRTHPPQKPASRGR